MKITITATPSVATIPVRINDPVPAHPITDEEWAACLKEGYGAF